MMHMQKKHENQKGKVSGAVALKASDHVSEWLFETRRKIWKILNVWWKIKIGKISFLRLR